MKTTNTRFITASSEPKTSISLDKSNEFTTNTRPTDVGEVSYYFKASKPQKHEQVELIDADDFLNNLLVKHNLKPHLPEARRWLADEFYGDALPTLAALRLKKGLTQKQLASLVNEPQSSISRLESGDESPSIDRAAKLAKALEVSLEQFHQALIQSRENRKP